MLIKNKTTVKKVSKIYLEVPLTVFVPERIFKSGVLFVIDSIGFS